MEFANLISEKRRGRPSVTQVCSDSLSGGAPRRSGGAFGGSQGPCHLPAVPLTTRHGALAGGVQSRLPVPTAPGRLSLNQAAGLLVVPPRPPHAGEPVALAMAVGAVTPHPHGPLKPWLL